MNNPVKSDYRPDRMAMATRGRRRFFWITLDIMISALGVLLVLVSTWK